MIKATLVLQLKRPFQTEPEIDNMIAEMRKLTELRVVYTDRDDIDHKVIGKMLKNEQSVRESLARFAQNNENNT